MINILDSFLFGEFNNYLIKVYVLLILKSILIKFTISNLSRIYFAYICKQSVFFLEFIKICIRVLSWKERSSTLGLTLYIWIPQIIWRHGTEALHFFVWSNARQGRFLFYSHSLINLWEGKMITHFSSY